MRPPLQGDRRRPAKRPAPPLFRVFRGFRGSRLRGLRGKVSADAWTHARPGPLRDVEDRISRVISPPRAKRRPLSHSQSMRSGIVGVARHKCRSSMLAHRGVSDLGFLSRRRSPRLRSRDFLSTFAHCLFNFLRRSDPQFPVSFPSTGTSDRGFRSANSLFPPDITAAAYPFTRIHVQTDNFLRIFAPK